MVIWVNIFQTESMAESIPSVQLELLIKYYSRNLARTPIQTHIGDEKWPLFVNNSCFGGLHQVVFLLFFQF